MILMFNVAALNVAYVVKTRVESWLSPWDFNTY